MGVFTPTEGKCGLAGSGGKCFVGTPLQFLYPAPCLALGWTTVIIRLDLSPYNMMVVRVGTCSKSSKVLVLVVSLIP